MTGIFWVIFARPKWPPYARRVKQLTWIRDVWAMWRSRRFLQGVDFCWGVSFVEGVSWEIPDFRRYTSFGVCVCFWQFPGFLSCCARFRKIQDFRRNSFATGEMGWRFLGISWGLKYVKVKKTCKQFSKYPPLKLTASFYPEKTGCSLQIRTFPSSPRFLFFDASCETFYRGGNNLSHSLGWRRCLGDTHSSASTRWRGGTAVELIFSMLDKHREAGKSICCTCLYTDILCILHMYHSYTHYIHFLLTCTQYLIMRFLIHLHWWNHNKAWSTEQLKFLRFFCLIAAWLMLGIHMTSQIMLTVDNGRGNLKLH